MAEKNKGEREFETGMDEVAKMLSGLVQANAKRTYDLSQSFDTGVMNDARAISQKQMLDAGYYDNQQKMLGNYAVARLIGAGDIANDRIWNVDEQGQMAVIAAQTLAKTPVFLDTILEMLLARIAETQAATGE